MAACEDPEPAADTADTIAQTGPAEAADTSDAATWIPPGLPTWLPVLLGAVCGFAVGALALFWRCRKKYGGLKI